MYNIELKLLTKNNPSTMIKPIGVVLHETATPGATAMDEYNYFNKDLRYASAHAFIDHERILQTIQWYRMAWHAGASANKLYIGVELCHFEDLQKFNEIWKRGVWLIAHLFFNELKITTVTDSNLMSHAAVSNRWKETDHQDPIEYFKHFGKTIDDFRKDVQIMLNDLTTPLTDWKDILNLATSKPDAWINAVEIAVSAAKAEGDLGALEIFQYLPDLILKVYKLK